MALIRGRSVGSLFSFVWLLCSFSLLPQSVLAQGNPRNLQIGIDPRSNLTGETEESRQKILEGIHSLGATWVRDGFARSPHGVSDLVDVVRRAKQLNLRFIVQVVQLDGDYDVPLQPNRCGWHAKPLGQINLTKYTNRLRAQLDALKAANLTVDAFEIGNEDDTDCYNADIPTGRTAAAQDLKIAVRGYGEFLMASAEVIHDPKYYPQAKLITFGMAHGGNPSNSLPEPAQFVAMLCFYSYSVWLVDESGNPMPQAEVLANRAQADAR